MLFNMGTTSANKLFQIGRVPIVLGWIVFLIATVAVLALFERQQLHAELRSEAEILHRLASQRADQHDAHMTSLSALAVAGKQEREDLFLEVVASILRFYPRIEAIDLVPLMERDGHLTSRTELNHRIVLTIHEAATASNGALVLRPAPSLQGRYLIVKRSPNTDQARFGLALQIDARALLASDRAFWQRASVTRLLGLPDETALVGTTPDIRSPLFEKQLGSASQPLIFRAGIAPGLFDLLSPGRLAGVVVVATLLYFMAVLALRQRSRAHRAETRARLSEQEVRLAHASRVNALGEMASGMAHELTQPLTAILSQAQAGQHLTGRTTGEFMPVLDSIEDQAKRAAAILDRLRNWTRPRSEPVGPVSVGDAIRGVEHLLRPEAERAGIAFQSEVGTQPLQVHTDQVELEQVIFNLTRNAMDAAADSESPSVLVIARGDHDQIVVEVKDSGPGVPEDIKLRLFDPFVTRKPDGTGLGLTLCLRLVEHMNGVLELVDDSPGTTFRVTLPRTNADTQEAAE